MTAPERRAAVLAALLLLVVVPAASANTALTSFAGGVATVTNDGDSETFTVALKPSSDPEYVVTSSVGTLPLIGAGCALSSANKVLTCNASAGIDRLVLNGGGGNDTVTISGSNGYANGSTGLTVGGGPGNDTLIGSATSSLRTTVTGDADNDTFVGSATLGDSFRAEAGNDTYLGGTRPVPAGFDAETYQLNFAQDTWSAVGGAAVNVSDDGAADDTDGQGGTDDVRAVESLTGGDGNDTLRAGGASYLTGGDGNDALIGGGGPDYLQGQGGNDGLAGGGGQDTLVDGDFEPAYVVTPDTVGPAGNDALNGGDGDDMLYANRGRDDVRGGGGVDSFFSSRIDTQVLPSYPDSATFVTRFRGVPISLDDLANDGPTGANEGDDVHSDVEAVDTSSVAGSWFVSRSSRVPRGGPGYGNVNAAADVVTGSASANLIRTGGGDDAVDGRGGPGHALPRGRQRPRQRRRQDDGPDLLRPRPGHRRRRPHRHQRDPRGRRLGLRERLGHGPRPRGRDPADPAVADARRQEEAVGEAGSSSASP